ncbi:MAG: dihydroorotate dehydrogenase-like protein [Phycisphaerae bacterium]|nr:dihydroorotate dehydrogenase-like protein [Phycisphaerae bacterium]
MDLSTTYMGLKLKNPLVPAASPLSTDIDTIKQMEDAGASAIVLHSLFEEQISFDAEELDHYLSHGAESFAEAVTYFPQADEYRLGPEQYLEHIRKAKDAVNIPIIASLNGVSLGGWVEYAKQMQAAGADALELNVYFIATNPRLFAEDVDRVYVDILAAIKNEVKIPVAIKLSPFFSAMAAMAKRLADAGADGLVLFNRFYQPDIDLDTLEVVPSLVLSSSHELRLPLRWVAILHGNVPCSLAANSGISSGADVLKALMAGADIAQVASVLLRHGVGHLATMLSDMQAWMTEREYESVEQLKGSMSQKACVEPAAFERANYMKALNSYA